MRTKYANMTMDELVRLAQSANLSDADARELLAELTERLSR